MLQRNFDTSTMRTPLWMMNFAWMSIRTSFWALFNPRGALVLARQIAKKPMARYKAAAAEGAEGAKLVAVRAAALAFILSIILWLSIFLYVAFYYTYMPSITHTRPVHFKFQRCNENKGICSFPSAHVRLTKNQQILMVGQAYKIGIDIEMPESEVNKNLGMFMCCVEMRSRKGGLISSSCRSGMLAYKSPLLTLISTIVKAPLMIAGMHEEKQTIRLELFSSFEDDKNQPVTDVYVEIQSQHIEMYSATLNIAAHFTGLRYVMFHWPYLSAAVGVTTNLLFMALVFMLSWYHLQLESDGEETIKGEVKPFGGGTENFLFDSDDVSTDLLDIKKEDDSQSSDDVSIIEESTEDDKVITVEE